MVACVSFCWVKGEQVSRGRSFLNENTRQALEKRQMLTETTQTGNIFFCADLNEPQASCILCLQNFHLAKLPSLRNRSCSSFSDVGVVFLSSHPLSCVFSLLKWSPVCFPCWNGLPPGALLTLLLCPTCFSSRNACFQKHVPLWPSAFGKQKCVQVSRQ